MELIPDRLKSVSLLKVLRLLQLEKQLPGMVGILLVGHVTSVMPEQFRKAEFPMELQPDRSTEPEMPLQPLKAEFPMEVQLDRLTEPVMPEQPLKAKFPMEVQPDRLTEPVIPEQLENAESPMEVIPERLKSVSLLKVLRFVQREKQFLGMVGILLVGHVTLVMPEQPSKALLPTEVQPDRSTEPVMPVQPAKAEFPMEVIPERLKSVSLLTVLRLAQPKKQLLGMVDMLLVGHVTSVMQEQPSKAQSPM